MLVKEKTLHYLSENNKIFPIYATNPARSVSGYKGANSVPGYKAAHDATYARYMTTCCKTQAQVTQKIPLITITRSLQINSTEMVVSTILMCLIASVCST